jgi:DNA-binding MarR family transcriptional regulator
MNSGEKGANSRNEFKPLQRLRSYSTLNNEIRLKAFLVIHDHPGISFNDLAQKTHADTAKAAYHVGLLRASGLTEVSYEREGKATSHYSLTGLGKETYDELFGKLPKQKLEDISVLFTQMGSFSKPR